MHRNATLFPSWAMLMTALTFVVFLTLGDESLAQSDPATWEDVSSDVSSTLSNPRRSRRSQNATVSGSVTANEAIEGPLWLELDGLSAFGGIGLQGADGTSEDGDPYTVLSEDGVEAGETINFSLVITGGRRSFSFNPQFFTEAEDEPSLPEVAITSPETLTTVGTQSVQLQGTVGGTTSLLTVNGESVSFSSGTFSTFVSLEQGLNTIVARATSDDGQEATASIVVSQDLTPPVVTIETPEDGALVNTPTVAVTGLVNDIVRGTVTDDEAVVTVNGRAARIENRTYLAENVPLNVGLNTITVTATDQVGNVGTKSIEVTYEEPDPNRIELVDGQAQSGEILSILNAPLEVQLQDADGSFPENKMVVFRVVQGDGQVGAGTDIEAQAVLVPTDDQGKASTPFQVGSRAGTGNQRVRATAAGYDGEVIFYADATPKPGNKVSIIDGNNQRGGPGQPLPKPLTVSITDSGANLIRGTNVTFEVTAGGGSFEDGSTSKTVVTDGDGRASVVLVLGDLVGFDVHRVIARIDGVDAQAGFTASALEIGDPGETTISGVVLDNQDNPVPGVTIRVEGVNRQAVADENGQFVIEGAPVGPVHLFADGSTATVPGEWPNLSYNIVTIAGADNPLPAPIYMVKLDTENAQLVGLEDVEFTLPEVPGFRLTVQKDSVTFPDGARSGLLSVTPVNANKIPMAPPNGMQPQLIVTIQPAGTKFDPPAPLQLPNVDGFAPGSQVEMYSYDHDIEEFVTIGLGTVSSDGAVVASNTGVGVVKAGWHCGSQPGGSGCAHNCPVCQDCDGDCNCVPAGGDPRLGKCQKCSGGQAVPDDKALSDDNPGDCKRPECQNGSVVLTNNDSDEPEEPCQTCENGNVKNEPDMMKCKPGDTCFECKNGKCERVADEDDGPAVEIDFNISDIIQILSDIDKVVTKFGACTGTGDLGFALNFKAQDKKRCCDSDRVTCSFLSGSGSVSRPALECTSPGYPIGGIVSVFVNLKLGAKISLGGSGTQNCPCGCDYDIQASGSVDLGAGIGAGFIGVDPKLVSVSGNGSISVGVSGGYNCDGFYWNGGTGGPIVLDVTFTYVFSSSKLSWAVPNTSFTF